MAAEEEELELDVNQPKSNKMTTILLIVLIVLVLIVGGVGAWLYFSKDSSSESDAGDEASSGGGDTEKVLKPLHYLSMVPEFVVNFGPGSKVRYLQVDLQVSSRNEAALAVINTYRPVLRNDILVLLSGSKFDDLKDRPGKENLQKKLLASINKVVNEAMHPPSDKKDENASKDESGTDKENEIATGPIENVYFTSFIMQ